MDLILRIMKALLQKVKTPLPQSPNNNSLIESSKTVLINDEGYRETPYLDTKGNYTIGVGYLIGKSMSDLRLTRPVIMYMLTEQVEICIKELIEIFGSDDFYSWEEARQVAMVSMIYTLGKTKLLGFRNTINAIKTRDWEKAGQHIKESKWARDVDPRERVGVGRDDRIVYMITEGKYHAEYKVH